jgi:hypothetical protein
MCLDMILNKNSDKYKTKRVAKADCDMFITEMKHDTLDLQKMGRFGNYNISSTNMEQQ